MADRAKVTFVLDAGLLEQLREISKVSGVSQVSIVEEALAAMLARQRPPKAASRGPGAAIDEARLMRAEGMPLREVAARLNRRGFQRAPEI